MFKGVIRRILSVVKVVFRRFFSIVLSVMLVFSTSGVTECFAENVFHEEIPAEETVSGEGINAGEEPTLTVETVSSDEKPESDGDTVSSDESGDKEDTDKPANTVSSDDTTFVSTDTILPVAEESREPEILGDTNGSCGPNATWSFSGNTLTISGTGAIQNYDSTSPWNYYTDLYIVIINEGITSIGKNTFKDCGSIKYIYLPESIEAAHDSAFQNCTKLERICFWGSETKDTYLYIGDYAFYNCTSLKYISFPRWINKFKSHTFTGVTSANLYLPEGDCYYYDDTNGSYVKNATIGGSYGKMKTDGGGSTTVTTITSHGINGFIGKEHANPIFYNYDSSTKILNITKTGSATYSAMQSFSSASLYPWYRYKDKIETLNVSGLSSFGNYAFSGYSVLKTVTLNYKESLPDNVFNDSNKITTLTLNGTGATGTAFSGKKQLESLTINTTGSVTREAFSGCTNLKNLTITKANTIYGNAFKGCNNTGFTSVTLGTVSTVKTNAFLDCSYINSFDTGNATKIEYRALDGCIRLSSFTLGAACNDFGTPLTNTHNSIKTLTVAAGNTYYSGSANKNYIIENSIKKLRIGILTGNTTSFTVPNDVELTNYAFYNLSNLKTVTFAATSSVTAIGQNTFYGCTGLTKIEIPSSATIIDQSAFSGCTNLKTVVVPKTVTSVNQNAFLNCTGLTTINYYGSEYEWDQTLGIVETGNSAFNKNKVVWAYYEGDFDEGRLHWKAENKVLTITRKSGTGTAIPNFSSPSAVPWKNQASSITKVEANFITKVGDYAFYGFRSLDTATPSNLNLGTITSIGAHSFENCVKLSSMDKFQNCTSIGAYAFSGCTSLVDISIGSACTSIGMPLTADPGNIKSLIVNNGNGSYKSSDDKLCITNKAGNTLIMGINKADVPDGISSIGSYAFYNLKGVETVTIPGSVLDIAANAFAGCDDITTANYLGSDVNLNTLKSNIVTEGNSKLINATWKTASYEGDTADGNFHWEVAETALTISKKNTVTRLPDYDSASEVPWSIYASRVTSVNITDIDYVGAYNFCGFSKLTNENLTSPQVTAVGAHSFEDCDALTAVINNNSILAIGDYAFADCDGLTAVTMNNANTVGNYAFADSALTSITFPDNISSVGEGVLQGCENLTAIYASTDKKYRGNASNQILIEKKNESEFTVIAVVPGVDDLNLSGTGITEIGAGAFAGCENMTSITIPDSVKTINNEAFEDCTALTSINIPSSVTEIGGSVFSGCTKLETITVAADNQRYRSEDNTIIDKSTDTLVLVAGCKGTAAIPEGIKVIGEGAFKDCASLEDITVPDGLTEIKPYAFYGCSGLRSMDIPETVIKIGEHAFELCSGVETLNIPRGVTYIGDSAFENCYALTAAEFPDSPEENGLGISLFKNCSSLKVIALTRGIAAVPEECFMGCSSIASIRFYQGTKTIGKNAFNGAAGLESVQISVGLELIDENAFLGTGGVDNKIDQVYYTGSESSWNKIDIKNGNDPLKSPGAIEYDYEEIIFPEEVAITPDDGVISIGETQQLSAVFHPMETSSKFRGFSWTSSDSSIATVSDTGLVKAIKLGEAEITVRTNNAEIDPPLEASITIKVMPPKHTVTYRSGYEDSSNKTETVYEGDKIRLSPYKFYRDGYSISGWKGDDGKTYEKDEGNIVVNRNMEFTALWIAEETENPENPEEDKDPKEEATVNIKKPFTIKGADGDIPIEMYVEITKTVSYNGMKHVPQGSKVNKSTADDIVVSVSGNILDYVDQSKTKIKVKNNKFVSASGKPAQVIISFKPNGKDKSIKKGIKEINKALKNDTELSFEIVPLDLSTVSNLTVKTNGKKTKVSKVNGEVMVSGTAKAVKLGKKDFTAEINADAGTVTLTGQGNCTGTATVPLS